MAAKTNRTAAMSTRNPHAQREPAGRAAVGGSGVACSIAGASAGTMNSSLSERQLAGGRVVVKNLRVAPPLNRRFELTPRFVFAEVLVQKIAKKFVRQRAVGFRLQRLLHLPQQGHVIQRRLAENLLPGLNITTRKFLALRSDDRVAFFTPQQAKQHGDIHDRQELLD